MGVFGPKWKAGKGGGLKKLHNEELLNLYSSSSIYRVITSKEVGDMKRKKNVAHMGESNKV
jgi:hypothetical protein